MTSPSQRTPSRVRIRAGSVPREKATKSHFAGLEMSLGYGRRGLGTFGTRVSPLETTLRSSRSLPSVVSMEAKAWRRRNFGLNNPRNLIAVILNREFFIEPRHLNSEKSTKKSLLSLAYDQFFNFKAVHQLKAGFLNLASLVYNFLLTMSQ